MILHREPSQDMVEFCPRVKLHPSSRKQEVLLSERIVILHPLILPFLDQKVKFHHFLKFTSRLNQFRCKVEKTF